MTGRIFLSLAVSLALTFILEYWYAKLWGVQRQDMPLLFLVNLLTNPVVVLAHHMVGALWPAGLTAATWLLEVWAVGTEGYFYRTRSCIKQPWLFSITANLCSYIVGSLC